MEKIKAIVIGIIYFVLCMILGSMWLVGGIYGIFSPMYKSETYIYNLFISALGIALGLYLMNFWIKRNRKRKNKIK
ncbi:MAG: hypothetical protein P9M11_09310 [Candidatus Tenebribacter burtonii]|jgi:hypothetical protein|nr:hypothetical protein [Candidatus Tenebribacter burtonii]